MRVLGSVAVCIAILTATLDWASALEGRQGRQHRGVNEETSLAATADQSQQSTTESKIPRLLHYIHLGGYQAFLDNPKKQKEQAFFETCQKHHQHWDSLFWDESMAQEFLQKHYDWFLPIWLNYDSAEKKEDAIRPFIMHHYGGLILDLDVECYRPVDESLGQFDLITQGAGNGGIDNAVMASVPGHPYWPVLTDMLKERAPGHPVLKGYNEARYQTGIMALTKSLIDWVPSPRPLSGYIGGIFDAEGTQVKVSPIGEWFLPCFALDHICIKEFEAEKVSGEWDMSNLFGRHWFLETSSPEFLESQLQDYYVPN